MSSISMYPLCVGLLGGGVVGGGVVEILKSHPEIRVKTVVVSDTAKPRDWDTDGIIITDDINKVVDDPEINLVVDVMGGVDKAWEACAKAISSGKHVVSANKACLATKLKDLDQCFDTPEKRHKMLCFEAAVAGGVPIIALVKRSLATDHITKIGGILNGTTNYMLTAMSQEGLGYDEILKKAQAAGFAEADPTADVCGHDARHKLILLARLAFGVSFTNEQIPTAGITSLVAEDFAYAEMLGCSVKLLAEASLSTDGYGSTVRGFVGPVFIKKNTGLGTCDGVLNEVCVTTDNLGVISARGPGAGRFPTANSVVADILEVSGYSYGSEHATHRYPHPFNRDLMPEGKCCADNRVEDSMFYLRLVVNDRVGIIAELGKILAQYSVSIHAIHQTPILDFSRVTFCIITEKTTSFNMNIVSKEISATDFMLEAPFFCPFRGNED